MNRRRILIAGLGAFALALFIWPAVSAPIVLWSDSRIDLAMASEGAGIFAPAPARDPREPPHPVKPGWLLFLRLAGRTFPTLPPERSIVLTQSLLLWISISATALWLGRRRGFAFGMSAYALLLFFLRLRDSSSAVMSEALSAALLLPIAGVLLERPRRATTSALLGITSGGLFWIRPNVGALAFLLCALLLAGRPWRLLGLAGAGFALAVLPLWLWTRPGPGRDESRDFSYAVLYGSADYYWAPSLGPWPDSPNEQENARLARERARQRWSDFLSMRSEDARRQLLWRAGHGLLGVEFYDARWSRLYRAADTASRIASPLLVLAALALFLATPFGANAGRWRIAAPLIALALVGQNLWIGSHPRLALPFLPAMLLVGLAGGFSLEAAGLPRRVATLAIFALLLLAVAFHRGTLDWEWGRVESAGVRIRQRIPRGALPSSMPVTLHVRIASPVLPTGAHFRIEAGGRELYSSVTDTTRERPDVSVELPVSLLEANRREAVEITLVSTGDYDPFHYLLFPVVPPPWGAPASRDGSVELSPSTGIASGSLDWWAHAGADPAQMPR